MFARSPVGTVRLSATSSARVCSGPKRSSQRSTIHTGCEPHAASALALGPLGLDLAGPTALVVVLAVLDALLGMSIGLLLSAFARNEFQAVQFLPAVVLPQLLLCGLLADRDGMAAPLRWLSEVLPLTYAVDGMQELARSSEVSGRLVADLLVVAAVTVGALALGALTLRRQTD